MNFLIQKYYKKHEPLKFNCARLIYIEHALKTHDLTRAVVLANCFVNKHTIQSGYAPELEKEIESNCPEMFKNGLRIPEFYMNIIKTKVDSLNVEK